ncbi:T9SS type A sorting domain-containing protein [candidate division KSB1 bacterium]|nr:T9SS type A sorting domain-containing protein [candidate division KSB1 bacterium]
MNLRYRLLSASLASLLSLSIAATAASSYRSFVEWNGPYFNVQHALNSDSSAYLDYLVNSPLPLYGSPFSSPTAVAMFGSVTTPSVFVVDRDQRRVQVFTTSAGWNVEDLSYSATPVQGNFGAAQIKFSQGEIVPASERIRINGKFFRRVSSLTGYGVADSVYAIANSGGPNIGGVVALPAGWDLTVNDSVRVEYGYATPQGVAGIGEVDYVLTAATPVALPLQLNEATQANDPALTDLSSIALNTSVRSGEVVDLYLINSLSSGAGALASYALDAVGFGGAFTYVDQYPGALSRPHDVEIVETDVNTDGSIAENLPSGTNNLLLTESVHNQNTFLGHDYRLTFSFDTASTMNQSASPLNEESDIAFDPLTGRLHMVFCRDNDTEGTSYSYSDDYGQTWSAAVRISPTSLTGAHDRPRIALRSTGELHVIYEAVTAGERHLFHSYSVGGSTWSTNTNLTASITPSIVAENRYANLLVDLTDNVQVVWSGDDDVYHRTFSGSAWGAIYEAASGSGTGFSAPHCVMSRQGRIYMAYVSDAASPSKISFLLFNGVSWGSYETGGFTATVDQVTGTAGVASETSRGETFAFPQIALSGDTVWVFWVGQGTEVWPTTTELYYNRIDALDGEFTSGAGTALTTGEDASPQRFSAYADDLGNVHIAYPYATTADQDGIRYKTYDVSAADFSPATTATGRMIYVEGAAATQYAYEPRLICPSINGQVVPMLACGKAWTTLDGGDPRIVFKVIDGVLSILDQTNLNVVNDFLVWNHGAANSTAIPGVTFTITNSTDDISVTDDVDAIEFNVGDYFELDGTAPIKNDNLFVTDSDAHKLKVIRAYDNIDDCFGGAWRYEVPGKSDGSPLQTYKLGTVGGEGSYSVWASADSIPWTIVDDLLITGPTDRTCEVNRFTGEVRFGDGAHGLVPSDGIFIRVRYAESVDQAEYGRQGSSLGQLNLPRGIAARWNSRLGHFDIYLCDTGNNRLQKLAYLPSAAVDPDNWISPVVAWNAVSGATDLLSSPDDIEVVMQDQDVYLAVSDNGNGRLVLYRDDEATGSGGSTAPAFVTTIGSNGASLSQFLDPRGLAVMSEDTGLVVFTADADRDIVTKSLRRDWLAEEAGDSTGGGGPADNTMRIEMVDPIDDDTYLLLQRGATRTIELRASRTDSITALRTVLTFPPSMIDVISVNEGNLWSGERFTNKIFLYDFNNTAGTLEINASMVGDDDGLTTGSSRVIASIVVRADSFSVPSTGDFAFADSLADFRDVHNAEVSTWVGNDMHLRGGYLGDIASPSDDPGDPPNMIPAVDGRIDFADVNVFTQGWNGDGITFDPISDIGPYTGTTVPNLVANPDGRLDAYDLLSLSTMYNWYNSSSTTSLPEPPRANGTQLDAARAVAVVIRPTAHGWTAEVQARDVEALTTAHIYLAVDGPDATIDDASDGGFLGAGTTLFLRTVRGQAVDIAMGRLNPQAPTVSGSGVLASIELTGSAGLPPSISMFYELRDAHNQITATANVLGFEAEPVPSKFGLGTPFPNPFNATTTFTIELTDVAQAQLSVFNALGQHVATVVNRELPAGVHQIAWDARGATGTSLPTGIYFARLEANGLSAVRKIALLR